MTQNNQKWTKLECWQRDNSRTWTLCGVIIVLSIGYILVQLVIEELAK